jgi:hypothetical protein
MFWFCERSLWLLRRSTRRKGVAAFVCVRVMRKRKRARRLVLFLPPATPTPPDTATRSPDRPIVFRFLTRPSSPTPTPTPTSVPQRRAQLHHCAQR